MLSMQENQRLTRVGPGTPVGELLRRYWHPIAPSAALLKEPTKAVRILGEDLVLYRDRSGALGLIGQACAHRRVNLLYGIPEQHGLRCPYHGWLYDETGRCLEQPAEAPDSTFKDRIKLPAYPVQELGGLIWAYLGPDPAPLLPRWDLFVMENVVRDIGVTVIPCNWVQIMENSMDPVHVEWLHGWLTKYVLERRGEEMPPWQRPFLKRHVKIGFDVFDHGIIKRRVVEGGSEEDDLWRFGHPIVFPNILRTGGGANWPEFQYRVPMDDTHTLHISYTCYAPGPAVLVPRQDVVPYYDVPFKDQQGRYILDAALIQDFVAWVEQGPIADRSQERLAESDKGIILYRRLLREQLEKVAEGVDPMNVFRDPENNQCVVVSQEKVYYGRSRRHVGSYQNVHQRFSPVIQQVDELFQKAAEAAEKSPT
jgi:5,5'-dehydrodivanillate O-demethylase